MIKKTAGIVLISLLFFSLFFRICCGLFVIQPMGVLPGGITLVYWRSGTNIPFIASADRILMDSGKVISTHGNGEVLVALKPMLQSKTFMKLNYSERLFLWSLKPIGQ